MVTIEIIIFNERFVFGRHHNRGRAKGPTQRMAMTMEDVRKYHGSFLSAMDGGIDVRPLPSRNSPQCLHFIASSWISSAQNGHFFILYLTHGNLRIRWTRMFCQFWMQWMRELSVICYQDLRCEILGLFPILPFVHFIFCFEKFVEWRPCSVVILYPALVDWKSRIVCTPV